MILAIETATDVCSVVFENDEGKVAEKRTESRGSHSEKLFLFIKELMQENQFSMGDLDAVLVSEGPGSYTGLRIAASGVKGLLFGFDVPLFGVSTLASFGHAASQKTAQHELKIHAIIDARRVHVYHQSFILKEKRMEAGSEVATIPIEKFQKMVEPDDIIVGTGIERLDEKIVNKITCFDEKMISARSLIGLYHRAEASNFIHEVDAAQFDPKYYTSNQVNPA